MTGITTTIRKRINHADSLADYPRGCIYCGHDVAYLSTTVHGPGSEADYFDRPRTVETLDRAEPLCPTCAKGPGTRHHKDCRGCRY